ncbi:fimbria/pilus chaperone family protein [Escherichia coli]|nr:fimbria/pilus chaperone family protein [Escherichia coli]EFD2031739.1 fimbria/pilus periplasmic chaperone [Escherichia coli O157:H7]EFB7606507.1 hypothetical protein [Escherichia coli]EFM9550201.1 fimbria/pilus periplasmic chaperone [Escherichia coli]EIX2829651.1 fimbria/pilus periplasmic chaperone [Escherichia coli]EKH2414282.1 fimbria/pilus periplasmic chaperone [Escherichia coli]
MSVTILFKQIVMFRYLLVSILFLLSKTIYALGMQPETTVLVLDQEDGEASITVKNTNDTPALLQTRIVDVDGAKGVIVLASPSIVKVDSGEEQTVRFFLQTNGEIKNQQLKRIRFLGLPAKKDDDKGKSSVSIAVSQSIPLIINPNGLKHEEEPWKFLNYKYENGRVYINNPSRYVVRMYPEVYIDGTKVNLQQSFISPMQKVEVNFTPPPSVVTIKPVSLYGVVRDEYKIDKSKT